MKNLPLGIQTFKKIIEENKLYVDKTKDIYEFFSSENTFFFLSRPRRFGKSLLVTTLKEIFLGNKELFKGLWIYDKIDFKKYPVIHIDFLGMNYSEGNQLFKKTFLDKIKNIAESYNIQLNSEDYKSAFRELIKKLSEIEKVVILIDEYDKPIIEYVDNIPLAIENKNILKGFYEVLKESDEYIKFAFLTGVSKFSKVSIFSGLNNLRDITLEEKFSTITGYTEKQLFTYFEEYIKVTANKLNIETEKLKKTLKIWYNGYSWDSKNFVYNPFSILNVFTSHQINNYWFQSGTPTLLIKLIKEKNFDIKKLDNYELDIESFSEYEIENINVQSLLFQTGYLTIKEIIENELGFNSYILGFPNIEVKESLLKNLLINFSYSTDNSQVLITRLTKTLEKQDLITFFEILKDVFNHIPSVIFMSDKEAYYHTIIYLILTLIGVRIKVEVHTNKGRIDAVVETDNNIYIFELKMTSTKQAIRQIETKKYYESYLLSKKEILLVGVSFSTKERNIKNYSIKRLSI